METITYASDVNRYDIPELEKKTHVPALICGITSVVAGIALISARQMVGSWALSYPLIVVGIALACFGLYQLVWRSKRWYYKPSHSVTSVKEYYYHAEDFDGIMNMLTNNNLYALNKIKAQHDGPVKLRVIISADKNFAAAQVFRYVQFQFKPESDIVVHQGKEALAMVGLLQ